MKRRTFLKQATIAATGMLAAPYILPSGRLFAGSGTRLVNHVVFVLFAGGVRHQESIDLAYLSAQGVNSSGNIMPNILHGPPPSSHLVYTPWQPVSATPLAAQGTLFKELRYAQGPTGHFNGHTAALTGHYTGLSLDLNINPEFPTVFEYYRKHSNPAQSALNCWWISEGLGPYPYLNFSRNPDYGAAYGANYLRPISLFGDKALAHLAQPISFQPDDVPQIDRMKNFLNANFRTNEAFYPGIANIEEDRHQIKQFVYDMFNKSSDGLIEWALPPLVSPSELTSDLITYSYAWEVLRRFRPELTVINSFALDACHFNFTSYIQFMHKADYGVGWLWQKIQSDPVLKDDTILICMPDHGRNEKPNNLYDANGLAAFDHTSDDNSRRHFALIVGPPSKVKQGQVVGNYLNPVGETIDIVPTIAHILGFIDAIPAGMLPGRVLHEAFV